MPMAELATTRSLVVEGLGPRRRFSALRDLHQAHEGNADEWLRLTTLRLATFVATAAVIGADFVTYKVAEATVHLGVFTVVMCALLYVNNLVGELRSAFPSDNELIAAQA